MNKDYVLGLARQQLYDAISQDQPPICDPLKVSPWIAMSLLQKAIRRGEERLALRAASTLLHLSPERLWRRCGCIAFEDIGVADLDTVAIVTAALAGKKNRASLGGEWRVASYIVSRMVHAPKCHAADDVLLAAENHPDFEDTRLAFAFSSTDDLIRIATGADPLPIRALAAWYAIGTDCRPSSRLSSKRGDPLAVFNALRETKTPAAVVEITREGFRKTSEVLCPFVLFGPPYHLFIQNLAATLSQLVDDPRALIEVMPMRAGVAKIEFFLAVSQNLAEPRVVEQQPTILIDHQQRRGAEFQHLPELALVLGRLGSQRRAAIGRYRPARRGIRRHAVSVRLT